MLEGSTLSISEAFCHLSTKAQVLSGCMYTVSGLSLIHLTSVEINESAGGWPALMLKNPLCSFSLPLRINRLCMFRKKFFMLKGCTRRNRGK